MVAYSFRKPFAPKIEDGSKHHTLRGPRRRHAREGETLQLYTGMRTKACRLVATKTCTQVCGVRLDFGWREAPVVVFAIAELASLGLGRPADGPGGAPCRVGPMAPVVDVQAFARADGFPSFGAMARWWWTMHRTRRWNGFLVNWGEPYSLSLPARSEAVQSDAKRVAVHRPAAWQLEPDRWAAPAIAIELRRGGWSGEGLRTYRSDVDRRVIAAHGVDGSAPVWRVDGRDGDHASLEDLAGVLLRLDRDAATDREWAA